MRKEIVKKRGPKIKRGERSKQFSSVLPETILEKITINAMKNGISRNELVYRAIMSYMFPKKSIHLQSQKSL